MAERLLVDMDEGQNSTESANWQYNPDQESQPADVSAPATSSPVSVNWTASEYVAHHKSASWYMAFALIMAAAAALVYLFTRDAVSSLVIIILGILFGIFAGRPPEVLDYAIDSSGLHIGRRYYPYAIFKSFYIVEDGTMRSIVITPLQRFMLPISLYYDPSDEEEIIKTLSNYLPIEERGHDLVERLMRKVRF